MPPASKQRLSGLILRCKSHRGCAEPNGCDYFVIGNKGPGPIVALRRVTDSSHTFREKRSHPDGWVIWTKIFFYKTHVVRA